MRFRNWGVFLPLLLSGCGVSAWSHSEYFTFSAMEDVKLYEREMFQSRGMIFRKVYSNQTQQYKSEQKTNMVENIRFVFVEKNGGFVGLFPLIPPPPYMPIFFREIGSVCPVQSDVKMSISYFDDSDIENTEQVNERIRISDIRKIYLLKDDGMVILPRYFWNDGYSYQVCFPLKSEEVNDSILFVDGLVDKENKHITILPKRLRYYNDYIWATGYLGDFFSSSNN